MAHAPGAGRPAAGNGLAPPADRADADPRQPGRAEPGPGPRRGAGTAADAAWLGRYAAHVLSDRARVPDHRRLSVAPGDRPVYAGVLGAPGVPPLPPPA